MTPSSTAPYKLFLIGLCYATFLTAQTTCPPITLLSTPRVVAPDKQVVVATRQPDGSFQGNYGPRLAPYFYAATVPNLQATITSCYPGPTKKGSTLFSSYNRQGWASHLGDWADLDGDGVEDAVMIFYKPNLLYTVMLTSSNVLKSGSPSPVVFNGTPLSVRLADVNKDGHPDLIVAVGDSPDKSVTSAIWVVLNRGDGTFGVPTRFAAGTQPLGFAVIDVNGDGNLDLVVADQGSSNGSGGGGVAVLFGNGNGTFSSPSVLTASAGASSVVVGDFNGDGKLDIAAATGSLVTLYPGNGNGTFGTRVTFPSGGDSAYLAMGDLNSDGKLDLVVSNYNEQSASVLINNGTGGAIGFQAPVSYVISLGRSPDYLVVTDFNNDGIPDIVGGTGFPSTFAGNSNNAIDVLLGNGDGTFAAPQLTQVGTAPLAFAAAGDFNGDGKMDVAAMSKGSTNLLFFAGRGDGTFAAPVTSALGNTSFSNPVGAIAGDFNGDGVADLAIVTSNGFAIALSQKNGSFQPLNTIYRSALTTGGVALGDFNGDGKLDVATSLCTSSARHHDDPCVQREWHRRVYRQPALHP